MAAISGIEPAAGMRQNPPREEKGGRAALEFDAARGQKKRNARQPLDADNPSDGKGNLIDIEV